MSSNRVLVTGGSGFIASHCILQLLASGHEVRASLRSLEREPAVRSALAGAGMVDDGKLTFVRADLTRDDGWDEAMRDIDVVLHVASPVRPGHVDDENELIGPAREGTLRVLRAARTAGVRRVVLTSAFHAVGWGHPRDGRVFTEADWTVLDGPGADAYARSKTLAERAAWEFVERDPGPMDLVTMLPVAVMGPVVGPAVSGSNHLIQRLLNGDMPALPHLFFPIVDVRDVARAHLLAMTAPTGGRFLLSNGPAIEMKDVAATIRAHLGASARNVPTRTVPNAVLRLAARFNPEVRSFTPDLGYARRTSNDKARSVLGWTARDPRTTIVDAAESIVAHGLVKNT